MQATVKTIKTQSFHLSQHFALHLWTPTSKLQNGATLFFQWTRFVKYPHPLYPYKTQMMLISSLPKHLETLCSAALFQLKPAETPTQSSLKQIHTKTDISVTHAEKQKFATLADNEFASTFSLFTTTFLATRWSI